MLDFKEEHLVRYVEIFSPKNVFPQDKRIEVWIEKPF